MSSEDRTDRPARARAHAVTRLHADVDRMLRLERDLDQARRDVDGAGKTTLAAACGADDRAVA